MEHKYYKVTTGPFIEAVAQAVEDNEKATKAIHKFVDKVGAKEVAKYDTGKVAYFSFETPPDKSLWKVALHGHMPRMGTKVGKALASELDSLPKFNDLQALLKMFGLHKMMVLGEATNRGVRMHSAHFCGKHDSQTYFIKVPQEKGNEYKPTSPDLIECKEWEMLKFMDEE